VASTDLIRFVHFEGDLADAVTNISEEPHDSSARESRCAGGTWKVPLHLEKVNKTWVSLQVWMSSNSVNEPTCSNYSTVNNYSSIDNNYKNVTTTAVKALVF